MVRKDEPPVRTIIVVVIHVQTAAEKLLWRPVRRASEAQLRMRRIRVQDGSRPRLRFPPEMSGIGGIVLGLGNLYHCFDRSTGEFRGLFCDCPQLCLHQLGLELHHFLYVLGMYELLSELEASRDIAFSKCPHLAMQLLRT